MKSDKKNELQCEQRGWLAAQQSQEPRPPRKPRVRGRAVGFFPLVAVFAALFASTSSGLAQTTAGNIVGTLTDASGGAVAQTAVVLTNVATATTNEAVTDNSGYYEFVNVPPGNYKLTAQKAGFKNLTEGPLNLQVEGSLRINLVLQVGNASETVTVTSASPLIQAETTSLGAVIDERETTELPLNGRNPMSLAALTPGVVAQGGANSTPTGQNPFAWGNYQIGGGFANESATYLDGAPLNTLYINLTSLIPTQDSLGEFKVDTNNLTADYGHLAGGAINFSTKSGTNQLHGNVWEYLRNKVLNANDYFSNQGGPNGTPLARPAFTQNQYGFNVGGPIIIPHVYNGRDKTFFFVDQEWFALREGQTFVETVPTAAQLGGDLSTLPGAPQLYDPLTTCTNTAGCAGGLAYGDRQPIPGNNLNNAPVSTINPTAVAYAKTFYPAPNTAPNAAGVNNFTTNTGTGGNNRETVAHIDHNLTDKQHLDGRYTYWTNTNLPIDPLGTGICQDRCTEDFTNNNVIVRDSFAISPKTLLDVNFSFLRFNYARTPKLSKFDFSSLGSAWASLGSQVQFPGPPVMSIQNFDTAGTFSSQGADSFITDINNNYRVAGNLTKIFGKHTVKFGGEWQHNSFTYAQSNTSAGDFNFNNGFTSQNPNTNVGGAGLASYLLGYASSGSFTSLIVVDATKVYPGLYVTDSWRATPTLTLHVGLRWEDDYPFTEAHNNQNYFDTAAVNPLLAAAGINIPGSIELVNSATRGSRYAVNNFSKQFSPRVGFTYQARPNTVFSGGYGLFWIPTVVGWNTNPNNQPINTFNTPYTASINSNFTPANILSNPVPGGILSAPGRNADFQSILLGTGVTPTFVNNPYPYAQQWNASIQQQFGSSLVLNIAYAGAKGTHLPFADLPVDALPDADTALGATALQTSVPNPFFGVINPSYGLGASTVPASQLLLKYPQYSGVNIASAGQASSNYDALQIQVQKRFTGGASIGAGYTYAKLISDTDTQTAWLEQGVAGAYGGFVDPNRPYLERSLSSNDVRNRLTLVYVYDIPVGRGRTVLANASRPLDAAVGGWGVEGFTLFQSGFPLGFGVNNNLNGFIGQGQRPNVASGCNKQRSGGAVSRLNEWFNTSCFSQPAQFTYGNEARNDSQVTAPGIANWDASVFKNFAVDPGERVSVQFRAEFFNLFNRVQFAYPGTTYGTSNFGVISSQYNNPRLLQFALRLKF